MSYKPTNLPGYFLYNRWDPLTHALFIQAIELQPLGCRRARGPRPGNPLNGIQGMDEDAICAREESIFERRVLDWYKKGETRRVHAPTESAMLRQEEAVR